MRSYSIGGNLSLEVIFISSIVDFGLVSWTQVSNLRKIWKVVAEKFNYNNIYFWSHIPLEVIFHWRLSLKISDQWLLRGWSSIVGHLHLKQLWFWFGPLNLSLKFGADLTSVLWDILLLIFWGHLPLEVFHYLHPLSILVWSPWPKYKRWGISNEWLRR